MIDKVNKILIAQRDPSEIFGEVELNAGPTKLYSGDVTQSLATLFVFGITLIFSVAGIAVLIYLLWGAFEYTTSGGDKESMAQARGKMVNAVVGIVLIVVVFALWVFFMATTGIIEQTDGGFNIKLPYLE